MFDNIKRVLKENLGIQFPKKKEPPSYDNTETIKAIESVKNDLDKIRSEVSESNNKCEASQYIKDIENDLAKINKSIGNINRTISDMNKQLDEIEIIYKVLAYLFAGSLIIGLATLVIILFT